MGIARRLLKNLLAPGKKAEELGSIVRVCDGAERLWLERARELATSHLESRAIDR